MDKKKIVLAVGALVAAWRVLSPPESVLLANGGKMRCTPELVERMNSGACSTDVALLLVHLGVIAAITAVAWYVVPAGERQPQLGGPT